LRNFLLCRRLDPREPFVKRLFLVVAAACGAIAAFTVIGKRPPEPERPRSIGAVSSAGVTFQLVGLTGDACVTTVEACLAQVPGVARATVTRESACLAMGGATLDEKAMIAAVRQSGHEIAGSEAVSPRLAPLTPDEVRRLDELKGEWLEVHTKPPACLTCAMAFEGHVKELTGVLEVVAVHFRDHLAVKRDPATCPTSHLAEHIRRLTHEPVTFAPTKLVELKVENMTCNRCIGSIRGVLLRTDRVLSPAVEIGWAKVIVSTGTESQRVVEAVESAPGPSCKTNPEHVFKASVSQEKDDGAP
jgi:copper chaperone CopZ